MREILSDLVAEEQALDQFLQGYHVVRDWSKKTPAKGWTVRDIIAHLASSEEYVYNALEEGGSRLGELDDYADFDAFNAAGVKKGKSMRPQDVIEWWREYRAKVVDALFRKEATDRVPWFRGDLSAKTVATTRLMETWAHGLDIHETLGEEVEDTTRLRHIAWLGWATLPYAFELAGDTYEPVRVEVIGPDYSKWVFGPADTEEFIKGTAGEWCRVVVQRVSASKTNLKASGPIAEKALQVARAYL